MIYYNKYFFERTQIMSESAILMRRRTVKISLLLYVYIYLLFHIPNYVFDPDDWIGTTSWEIYIVIRDISERIVSYLVPVLVAAVIYVTESKTVSAVRQSLLYAAPVLVYSLPYCYLYAISEGYDTPESIGISLGLSAAGLLVQAIHIFALYILAKYLTAYSAYKKLREQRSRASRNPKNEPQQALWEQALSVSREDIVPDSPMSLSTLGGLGIFATVFAEFAVRLIIEIVNTVSLFIEAKGDITVPELLSMIFAYVFLLLELLFVFWIAGEARNAALREDVYSAAPETESNDPSTFIKDKTEDQK